MPRPPFALLPLAALPLGLLAVAQESTEEPAATSPGRLELIETAPVETVLDDPDLRETSAAWLELFRNAEETIELEHFYFSVAPPEHPQPGKLGPLVEELLVAARDRGVKVRVVADSGFHKTYPETLDLLGAEENIEVRLLDLRSLTGGVQHAKFCLVDGKRTLLGSANFDWRSLEHIQELGVLMESAELTAYYLRVFELDWRLAAGESLEDVASLVSGPPAQAVTLRYGDSEVRATPVASPKGLLPSAHDSCWDLPRLVELIDGAQERVRLQLLSYKPAYRNRTYFAELDNALRRAAARKVDVQLLFSNWSQSRGKIEALKSLTVLPGVEVRIATLPEWSGGFIDFARVVHSKYLVADGERAWVGTSNGSGDYFTASRNVGLIVEGAAFGADLDRYFERLWSDEALSATVDPCADYRSPKRSK